MRRTTIATNRPGAQRDPSSFALLCALAARLAAVFTVVGFLLLGSVAVTATGRIAAVALLFCGLAPVLLTRAWVDRDRRWFRGGLACGAVAVALVGELVRRAPRAEAEVGAKVSSAYFGSSGGFSRVAPSNLVPEVDQLMVCYSLVSVVDPLFTRRQVAELKSWTAQVYAELDRDPSFARLGSAMAEAYDELLGLNPTTGHAFVFVPPGLDRTKPAPVLVFFHGSGGNFKGYLWVLSRVADRCGMVLVAPSFGSGNWRPPETEAAFDIVLQAVGRLACIDPDRVHAVGLSNGGLGVSQLASVRGQRLRSLVLISPVFDRARIQSVAFALQCRTRPVLVLTGQDDDRVPLGYVQDAVTDMAVAGALPTLDAVVGANHFLVFSHRRLVEDKLVDWFSRNGVSAQP